MWSTCERIALISTLAIVMGALFVTTYSLALGDPVPHRIDAAVVGAPAAHPQTVRAVQTVAGGGLLFHRYPSRAAALRAVDLQHVYTVLDLQSGQPTLYVASAAGASVARVLEQIFQIGAHVNEMSLRHWTEFIIGIALAASLVFVLVEGALLHRLDLPVLEAWGILALQLVAVASFARLMTVLVGRWSILPTWLFFVVLGNSSSGGAVAPPLLPRPFAFVSQWLPSGATVTALRNAVYFHPYQHMQPLAVLATWAVTLFTAMIVVSRHPVTSSVLVERSGRVPAEATA